MNRYKYEISRTLRVEDGLSYVLEAYGNCRHSLLQNAYVYTLNEYGDEIAVNRYTAVHDHLFSQVIVILRRLVAEEELNKIYRAM